MPAKTRSKTRSTTTSTKSQVPKKPPVPAQDKSTKTKQTSKSKTSRKRTRHAEAEPEVPPKSKLEMFKRLPLELFIEIAKYLHPFELILLSRVNKFFRGVLMRRSAVKIWQSSLGTIRDLPPCPDDLCEPKYAALLFVGECSTCGVATPRSMDPILHVRLCAKCVKKQVAHISNFSFHDIQLISEDIIPAKRGESQQSWCLYYDAKAVETEYKVLLDGDQQQLDRWLAERDEYVEKRYREARVLRCWAKGKELDGFKSVRKAEIEERLLALGWEPVDFHQEEPWRRRQLSTLMYNAKPLDDKDWKNLLPRLEEHLEHSRTNRLKKEAASRQAKRGVILSDYLASLWSQRKPLAQATPKLGSVTGVVASSSAGTSQPHSQYSGTQRRNKVLLYPMFPSKHDSAFCLESRALLETDISMEAFELEFQEKKAHFAQWIDDSRTALELSLVKMLPNDIQPIDSQGTDFDLVAGANEDVQSLDCLPLTTRKLLRADVVFKQWDTPYFYPSDFGSWCTTTGYNLTYDPALALIARALLHTLGRPSASYLEMDALGKTFLCGRCNCKPVYYTWKNMVKHYRDKETEWQMRSAQAALSAQASKDFTLVFTHGTGHIDSKKPLVRIVHESSQASDSGRARMYQTCKLCHDVGIWGSHDDGYVVDHIRDVHLINDPVEGVHYEPTNSWY